MKKQSIISMLSIAAVLLFIAGCGQAYRLNAAGWGEKLTEVRSLLKEVGGEMQTPAQTRLMLSDAKKKEFVQTRLNNAQTMLTELKASLPATGPEHHSKLLSGIDELLTAIAKANQGIENKDAKSLQEFKTLSGTAGEKLNQWGDAVRNNE